MAGSYTIIVLPPVPQASPGVIQIDPLRGWSIIQYCLIPGVEAIILMSLHPGYLSASRLTTSSWLFSGNIFFTLVSKERSYLFAKSRLGIRTLPGEITSLSSDIRSLQCIRACQSSNIPPLWCRCVCLSWPRAYQSCDSAWKRCDHWTNWCSNPYQRWFSAYQRSVIWWSKYAIVVKDYYPCAFTFFRFSSPFMFSKSGW